MKFSISVSFVFVLFLLFTLSTGRGEALVIATKRQVDMSLCKVGKRLIIPDPTNCNSFIECAND